MKNEKKEVATLEALPKLAEQKPQGISMIADYWTPEIQGESKRVYIVGITEDIYDGNDERGEILLPCVFMIEEVEKAGKTERKAVKNGAKRLVAAIENGIKAGSIITISQWQQTGEMPTGIEIVYEGKKKNKNNAFQSDRFDVRKLG
jgi:hypothetical protein